MHPVPEERVLQPHDQVPHCAVTDLRGEVVIYSAIWQRRNLVLVTVGGSDPIDSVNEYTTQLSARLSARVDLQTSCVVTRDRVPGTACPGILVADRWGEIVLVAHGAHVADLPSADDLLEWLEYVQRQCPECQGETK
jgi:hypothetical protein